MIRFPASRLLRKWLRTQTNSSYFTNPGDLAGNLPLKRFGRQQKRCFRVRPIVAEALRQKKPVVALESTIITHGMPYPTNVKTALQVEKIIKSEGAIPATVGVVEGKLIVGLEEEEIKFLGETDNKNQTIKTSRRDLAYVLSQGLSGGTTVSGTMVAAHKAGIPVFVTGGIGGVHRGASQSFDISADLTELGKTPIAVICAGIKSILDIELTLEYLETQGVTVVTFGEDKEFPAFFTPKSGFKAPFKTNSTLELAQLIDENLMLGLDSGVVVGVPIPDQSSDIGNEIESITKKALEDARTSGIAGKDVTPFVLQRVNELTGGKSLEANIALIENNARVGAQVAVELSKINRKRVNEENSAQGAIKEDSFYYTRHANRTCKKEEEDYKRGDNRPVVIGGSVFDLMAITESRDVLAEVTNKGKLNQNFGGVGRNIAECLARLDVNPLLISAVGQDTPGNMMLDWLRELNMETRGVLVSPDLPTASYSAIMNNGGEILMAVGDMQIHDEMSPEYILEFEEDIKNAPIVCIDGNLNTAVIEKALKLCLKHEVPVWYEPTDMSKAAKPFTTNAWQGVTYISPNKRELQALESVISHRQEGMVNFNSSGPNDFAGPTEDQVISECMRMSRGIIAMVKCLVITLGRFGVLVLRDESCDELFPVKNNIKKRSSGGGLVSAVHYPAVNEDVLPRNKIKSVSGAGDSLAAAMIASIIRGDEPHMCVKAGLRAASLSLKTHHAISYQINPDIFTRESVEEWTTLTSKDIAL